ncbi:MAG: helix-turn-helix transcriptional regulator [Tenericutes bacterium]|nr:helix-turn-helix transcriptional regulator [Mycoplasmatota bacterium]
MDLRMYLVNARQNKGYSQRRTAREAGVSYQHYAKIENGDRGKKVSFLTIGRIAQVLDIPLEDFYRFEKEYADEVELNNESRRH